MAVEFDHQLPRAKRPGTQMIVNQSSEMVLSSANAGTQAAIKAGKALVDDCKANSSCDRIAPSNGDRPGIFIVPHERATRRVARALIGLSPLHRAWKPFQPPGPAGAPTSKQSNSKALNAALQQPRLAWPGRV